MGSSTAEDFPATEIECPNCGERVYYEATACPKCGLHFYVDEVTGGGLEDEAPPEKQFSISAVTAAWLVSAGIALLIHSAAGRIWAPDALTPAGQALLFAAGPLGALAGGYLAARLAGKHVLLHGLVVTILTLLSAILLERFWYDPFNEPLQPRSIASWIVLVLTGMFGAWLWRRLANAAQNPSRKQPGEKGLYLDLLSRVRHDVDTAERLIDYERRRNPTANRQVWIQYAIHRIEHDRR